MRPAKNLAKDMGRLVFWYPFRRLSQILPFRAVPLFGKALGAGDRFLSGRRRASRIMRNIRSALDCDEIAANRILLANLQEHGMNMIEFMKYPQMDARTCRDLVIWDNRQALDDALQGGQGVLLLTAHFGAKQFLQVALGHAGYAVNQINYHLEGQHLSWIQQHVAQRLRMQIELGIPCRFISARGFLRDAFRSLQRNEILIVAADGIGVKALMDDSFQPFLFLGKTMRFPTNYLSLGSRTGSAKVACFVIREGHRHRIVFHAATNAAEEDAVPQYVAILESYVRRYPHLWEFWEEFCEGELLVAGGEGGACPPPAGDWPSRFR